MKITITISDTDYQNLTDLANSYNLSPQDILRGLAQDLTADTGSRCAIAKAWLKLAVKDLSPLSPGRPQSLYGEDVVDYIRDLRKAGYSYQKIGEYVRVKDGHLAAKTGVPVGHSAAYRICKQLGLN